MDLKKILLDRAHQRIELISNDFQRIYNDISLSSEEMISKLENLFDEYSKLELRIQAIEKSFKDSTVEEDGTTN